MKNKATLKKKTPKPVKLQAVNNNPPSVQALFEKHFDDRDTTTVRRNLFNLFYDILHSQKALSIEGINGVNEVKCFLNMLEDISGPEHPPNSG